MKKLYICIALVSLLSSSIGFALGQGLPRRVGDQPAAPQTTTRESTTPTTTAPAKPPVLGGANYPNNQKPQTQADQSPSGPEEVDAGDIVKVNTTLVTIPVSVMDRDG